MSGTSEQNQPDLLETGVPGLDDVLCGGLAPKRLYLIEGDTGVGKTTLALQFLLAGARNGEACMFVTLSETEEELRAAAESHGWSLDGISVLEIIASEESLTQDARYTMFHPSEVELAETTKSVLAEARRIQPRRLVVDSLTDVRLMADNPLRYRRQIVALKQYLSRQDCAVLFIDDQPLEQSEMHLHSMAHGVVSLESLAVEYGTLRRRLQVKKLRGCSYREGYHDFAIRRGGLTVFPRLVAAEHKKEYTAELVRSGLNELDALLGGGLTRGTSALIQGPAGSGKSSLATQFVHAAASRGEHAAVFLFDESIATLSQRSDGLGLPLGALVEAGRVTLRQVDPAELSPGEFSHAVCGAVEHDNATIIVIDSLLGYLTAMPSERFLALHLHELLSYLGRKGVTTLLTVTQHGILGDSTRAAVEATYVADTVLLLRYFEAFGEIRQAVSVIKKRTGKHERTIRELSFNGRIKVGPAIREIQGVLSGTPEFVGKSAVDLTAGDQGDGRS